MNNPELKWWFVEAVPDSEELRIYDENRSFILSIHQAVWYRFSEIKIVPNGTFTLINPYTLFTIIFPYGLPDHAVSLIKER